MSKSNHTAPAAIFTRPNSEDESAVDLYLYGSIPDVDWDTWSWINTDQEFIDKFREAESAYDRINIHINSPGGVISEGLVMFNTIRSSKKEVHTYNDGLAASMGAMILMAGHTVHAPSSSIIMLHSAIGGVYGNKDEIMEYVNILGTYENSLIEALAGKWNKPADEIRAEYFDGKDHFMTGTEAAEAGLIDVLETYEPIDLPDNVTNMSAKDVQAYYTEKYSKNQKPQSKSKSIIMNLKDFFSGKAKPEGNTATVDSAELEQLRESAQTALNDLELRTEELNQMTSERDTLQEQVNTLTAERDTAIEERDSISEEFQTFKNEAGDTHSTSGKEGDDYNPGGKELNALAKEDEQVREKVRATKS